MAIIAIKKEAKPAKGGPQPFTSTPLKSAQSKLLEDPSEKKCAIVRPRLLKEAGRLVQTHKADPRPSTFQERMKIMATHTSATEREETPHVTETTRDTVISDALRRRAQSVIKDRSIDRQSRTLVRYGLEVNDPYLAELVRRIDAGGIIVASLEFPEIPETNEDDPSEGNIEALAEIICRGGDESETKSAALFVLMGRLENSRDPKLLANSAKHFAFSRCGELNLYGMVDAQIPVVEGQLLAEE